MTTTTITIPSRKEFMGIKNNKSISTQQKHEKRAGEIINQISTRIRQGRFSTNTPRLHPQVALLVTEAFQKAGYTVEVEEKEVDGNALRYKFTISME